MKNFNEWLEVREDTMPPEMPDTRLARKGSMGSMAKIDPKYRQRFRMFLDTLPEHMDPNQRPHLLVAFLLEMGYSSPQEAFSDVRNLMRRGVKKEKIDTPLMPPQDGGMGNTSAGTSL